MIKILFLFFYLYAQLSPTMDLNTISCSASLEELSTAGEVLKKAFHRNITFTLGRNEFRDVILCVSYNSKKEVKHILRDITVHKKFVKDGKATVKLIGEKLQYMISNCAPDKLVMFLKTMSTKLECLRKKGFVPDRMKWKSDLPREFQEISPLTMRDLKEANEAKGIDWFYERFFLSIFHLVYSAKYNVHMYMYLEKLVMVLLA